MKLNFESDFQKKILYVSFESDSLIASEADLRSLRGQWLAALKSWHSPYKALIDCRNLSVDNAADVAKGFGQLMDFLKRLFLKKAVGYGFDAGKGHENLPFKVHVTEDEAGLELGLGPRTPVRGDDFRGVIHFDNDFRNHIVELSFDQEVNIETSEQILILKSKLTNNLMQWHSRWSLLVDCSKLSIASEVDAKWQGMVKFFNGFFLDQVLGYQPRSRETTYPFPCFRSRHIAVERLKQVAVDQDGADANCASRSTKV